MVMRPLLALVLLLGLLQACATAPSTPTSGVDVARHNVAQRIAALLPVDAILLGEQHDAPDHQRLQRAAVLELASRGLLGAVLLEMAEQGHSTRGLPHDATEAQVQSALRWQEAGWSWADYGPVVMAAVRNGVPVVGANLPRITMREAMANIALETRLPPRGFELQRDNIRSGHCGLLPEGQISPMARIQIARDLAMADAVTHAAQPGKTVLLIAGGGHVVRGVGVPAHLPATLRSVVVLAVAGPGDAGLRSGADVVWETAALLPKDYCASLRQRSKP